LDTQQNLFFESLLSNQGRFNVLEGPGPARLMGLHGEGYWLCLFHEVKKTNAWGTQRPVPPGQFDETATFVREWERNLLSRR